VSHKLTRIQAAPKDNYGAICAIYFLASLGLGGNIPIDATIALEFLPQNRRFLVALLSLWQPIGVVAATGIAYGTAARPKWRCDSTLPACSTGQRPCCTSDSNMGWRYTLIILGGTTLVVFFLRFFVFTFQESPKFLVSRGREEEAIQVLHNIAKFNRAPPPVLTVAHLAAVDEASSLSTDDLAVSGQPLSSMETLKRVLHNTANSFKHLKALFTNRLQTFIFVLLAIAYMVSARKPHLVEFC
jgi:MFS family permease